MYKEPVNEGSTEEQELTVCYYNDVSALIEAEKQLLQLENTLSHKMSYDPVTGMLSITVCFRPSARKCPAVAVITSHCPWS